jgi:hypothetical protein
VPGVLETIDLFPFHFLLQYLSIFCNRHLCFVHGNHAQSKCRPTSIVPRDNTRSVGKERIETTLHQNNFDVAFVAQWITVGHRMYSLSPSSSPSSPSSPHPPTVVFHTFLPSFMKSYTISMHHAAIITPGIVALRRLDNFVEVFIMVSMIFYPFLLMRALTGNNALDIGLSFVHSSVKMINIVLAILLRTSYARNIIRNLKFDLNSFSTLKPTL